MRRHQVLVATVFAAVTLSATAHAQPAQSWQGFNVPTKQGIVLGMSFGSYLSGWAKTIVATMDETAKGEQKPETFVFRDPTLTGDALDRASDDLAKWISRIDGLYAEPRNGGLQIVVAATAAACEIIEVPRPVIDEGLAKARGYTGTNEQVIAFLGVIEREHFAAQAQ